MEEIMRKQVEIYNSIRKSRDEPVISLENIAEICGQIFSKEEIEAFIKVLNDLKEA